MLFKHNKSGELYLFTGTAINKTNDTIVVTYTPLNGPDRGQTFVRDEADFNSKFTKVG